MLPTQPHPNPALPRWRRNLLHTALLLIAAASLVQTGCQGTRSAMQMDSDSNTPFFSFQVPVKNTDSESPVATAQHTRANDDQELVQPLTLQQNDAADKSRWSRWIDRLKAPRSIPLPRTDINEDGEIVELEAPRGSVDDF